MRDACVHHDLAHDWFADLADAPWATCATTENGFLRILANPAYHGGELRVASLVPLLRRFCATKRHRFWNDAVSLRDSKVFDPSFVRGHRQLTDVYLLGLAKHMGGQLATFDKTIPLKAVVGARPELLQIIEA